MSSTQKLTRAMRRRRQRRTQRILMIFFSACILAVLALAAFDLFWGESQPPAPDSGGSEVFASDKPGSAASLNPATSYPEYDDDLRQLYMGRVIPECEPVDDSYFYDAVFIGDSLTEGFKYMPFLKNTLILSQKGVNPMTVKTAKVFTDEQGAEYTAAEAIRMYAPKKIYIMLGTNGIAWLGIDDMAEKVGEFIDILSAENPGSIIIVQEMMPVTAAKEAGDDRFSLAKIYAYNTKLFDMCQQKGALYCETTAAVRDEAMYLPSEASPNDGIHFTQAYYRKWYEYLKSHAVKELIYEGPLVTSLPAQSSQIPPSGAVSG